MYFKMVSQVSDNVFVKQDRTQQTECKNLMIDFGKSRK
jgi:CRISPR/Cas system-associated endonuclease Cas1